MDQCYCHLCKLVDDKPLESQVFHANITIIDHNTHLAMSRNSIIMYKCGIVDLNNLQTSVQPVHGPGT